jgi:sucrose phosphorylase
MQGVPGIYVHSLLGSRGDREAAESSGIPRRINRAKLDRHALERELNQADSLRARVYRGFSRMLRARRGHAAFRPDAVQEVRSPRPEILVVKRGAGDETTWCIHNISAKEVALDGTEFDRELPAQPRDRLGGRVAVAEGRIQLPPYAVFWLGA